MGLQLQGYMIPYGESSIIQHWERSFPRQATVNGHDPGTDLLEVPTIYKAYFLGLCKGISQQNMALYGTVPPF